jgi:GNAT superfamily N-acetyltransferase
MEIKNTQVETAIEIIQEAAKWLIQIGKPLWRLGDLTVDRILKQISREEIYVGWENDQSIAAMILQWHDPSFWKDVKPFESGFIHKLSVRRAFAGKGHAKETIRFAESECLKRDVHLLRLDCAGDRPKLCRFYESLGFEQVQRKMVGKFDVAFYEKKI